MGRDSTDLAISFCRGAEHPRPLRLRLPVRHRHAGRRDADGLRRLDASVAGDRWWTFDPHNNRRNGRIVIGRGRDASDLAMPITGIDLHLRHGRTAIATAHPAFGTLRRRSWRDRTCPSRQSLQGVSVIGWCHGTKDKRSSLDLAAWEGHEMVGAQPAQRRRLDVLTESRAYFVPAMRARAGRFRIVFWIGVLLLPQLILVLLDHR